jgi:hypothetical protein
MEGEAWQGPSVLEALEGVSAKQAATHPIAGAYSIRELVLHLCGTYGSVLWRLGVTGGNWRSLRTGPLSRSPVARTGVIPSAC